jgi:hypothetical protein
MAAIRRLLARSPRRGRAATPPLPGGAIFYGGITVPRNPAALRGRYQRSGPDVSVDFTTNADT